MKRGVSELTLVSPPRAFCDPADARISRFVAKSGAGPERGVSKQHAASSIPGIATGNGLNGIRSSWDAPGAFPNPTAGIFGFCL